MNRYVIVNKIHLDKINFLYVIGDRDDVSFFPDDTFILEFTGQIDFDFEYEGPFIADEIIPILENRFPYEAD